MPEVWFYHLTRRPLEAVLPDLLARSIGRGWRVEVRGREAARMEWLDQRLWLGSDEGFLPHGLAGGPHDALQPVLLTTVPGAATDTDCLIAIDGTEVSDDDARGCARVCIVFDGSDEAALARARSQWKSLTSAGLPAAYWSEESGRWEKKAESAGTAPA